MTRKQQPAGSKKQAVKAAKKLSVEEFTLLALEKLRQPPHRGIHAVYSGFNEAFREYFDLDPVVEMQKLAEAGKIHLRPAKGGMVIMAGGLAPNASSEKRAKETLAKLGLS